ncbi:MAG: response regulator [Thermomicrobiales bacterium]
MMGPLYDSGLRESLRVLIVDDYADAADSLASLTRLWGYQCWVALTAQEALRLAAEHRPNAVILDLNLPDLSGWDLAVKLRSQADGDGLLILAVTGLALASDFERSRRAGCDLHMLKPADPNDIRRLLADHHARRKRHEA